MKFLGKIRGTFFLLKEKEMTFLTVVAVLITSAIGYACFEEYCNISSLRQANLKKTNAQNAWFNREHEINEQFRIIIEQILRRPKINQSALMNTVSACAKKLGLRHSLDIPSTEIGQFFSFNKLTVRLHDVYFSDIISFDEIIESPDSNLCVDDIEITKSGQKLSAKICVSALEISEESDINHLISKIFNKNNISNQLIKWNERNLN